MTIVEWAIIAFWVGVPFLAFWTGYELGRSKP